MNQFEQILKDYSPMITTVLKKAKVYKNYPYYRHVATIALWKAWKNYDPSRGDFAPYAYRCMLTSIYSEMNFENKQNERFICYEKEKLDVIVQYKNKQNQENDHYDLLDDIFELLNEDEITLLHALYVKGYTYQQLSDETGVSIAALKKRRNRIMKKLRETFSHSKFNRL